MESKIDIKKPNDNIKKDINKENKIVKKESGVYHDEHGKLLYTPDDEFEVRSCCGSMCSVDKPFLEFLAKTTVSLSVLAFCFIQLSQGKGDQSYLSSTISLILGTYLGSTTAQSKDKRK